MNCSNDGGTSDANDGTLASDDSSDDERPLISLKKTSTIASQKKKTSNNYHLYTEQTKKRQLILSLKYLFLKRKNVLGRLPKRYLNVFFFAYLLLTC